MPTRTLASGWLTPSRGDFLHEFPTSATTSGLFATSDLSLLVKQEVEEVKRWRRLVSSATPRSQDQVSIWSVAEHDARTFFRIAGVLWVVAIVFIVYKSWDDLPPQAVTMPPRAGWRCIGDFALAVLADFGTVGIAIAILSMMLTRAVTYVGGAMLTFYQRMVNRFVIPVIEAHKAEGREEGRTEGRTEVVEEWRAWNERRLAAEREGRQFNEPLPQD